VFTSAMVLVFVIGYLISWPVIGPIIRLARTFQAVAAFSSQAAVAIGKPESNL
jgi:HAMP domain-containing protein